MPLGEFVDRIRERQEMKLHELAGRSHVSSPYLSLMLADKRPIPCHLVPGLAGCLNCPAIARERLKECPVMAALEKEKDRREAA